MKIKSINVVETIDADTPTIHSFTADDKGREQAKQLFRQIAGGQKDDAAFPVDEMTARFDDKEIEEALTSDHGLSDEDGSWTLQIIESEWRGVPIGSRMDE